MQSAGQHRRLSRRFWIVTVLVALVPVLVAGYAGYRALTAPPPPDQLHVLAIPGNTPSDLTLPRDQTITNAEQVRQMYEVTLALPKTALGAGACAPHVDHEGYQLTFSKGNRIVLRLTAYPVGCLRVTFQPNDWNSHYDYRTDDGAFWATLSRILNMPESALIPSH